MHQSWKEAVKRYAVKLGGELREDGELLYLTQNKRIIIMHTLDWAHVKDVLKDFDHYWDSCVPTRPGVLDFSRPLQHKLIGPGGTPDFLFPALPEPWRETRTYLGFARLRPGDVAVDLGAYAGTVAYFMARLGAIVLAVEPDPFNFVVLIRNLLGQDNVRSMRVAVWDHDGGGIFEASGSIGAAMGDLTDHASDRIVVRTKTLATLLPEDPKVNFIKMDIEGAELRVLAQATDWLKRVQPRLVVEPHPRHGIPNTPRVVGLLEDIGYQVCLLDQGLKDQPLIGAEFGRKPEIPPGLEFNYSPEWRGTLYDLEGV